MSSSDNNGTKGMWLERIVRALEELKGDVNAQNAEPRVFPSRGGERSSSAGAKGK